MAKATEADLGGGIADYRSQPRDGRRPPWSRRVLTGLVAAAALGGFAMVVIYSYDRGKQAGGGAITPVVTAKEGPTRMKPENPGGMKVPDQDKKVFGRLDPGTQTGTVERLLAPPERVVDKPLPLPPAPKEDLELAAPTSRQAAAAEARPAPSPPKPSVEKAPPRPAALATAAPPARNRGAAHVAAPSAGSYRVQLASLRSESAALTAWEGLRKEHRDLFGSLTPKVEKARVAGRGIFYRLQAGPLPDEAAAKTLCAAAKKQKIGCLVVRP